jgi:hypothetical protein
VNEKSSLVQFLNKGCLYSTISWGMSCLSSSLPLALSPVDVCPVREVLTSEPSIVHMWGETSTEEHQFTMETSKVFVLVDVPADLSFLLLGDPSKHAGDASWAYASNTARDDNPSVLPHRLPEVVHMPLFLFARAHCTSILLTVCVGCFLVRHHHPFSLSSSTV